MAAVVFTTLGVNHVIDMIDGTAGTATAWFVGMGSGTTTATEGDVDLTAPFTSGLTGNALGRATATGESQPNAHQLQWKSKLTNDDTSSHDMYEVGLYIADSGGSSTSTATTMWVRGNYDAISLATADAIEFTITLSAS